MKSLHEIREHSWQFQALAQMSGVLRPANDANQCFLLLHGLTERGRRVFRKLLPALPQNALIIAPNGPFPLPRIKDNKMDMGYAWYIYDRFEKNYVINKDMAISWLKQVLAQSNPDNLPLTIIGFSQGGYIAPQVAAEIPTTKLVIGIGCEFRSSFITDNLKVPLEAVHGALDPAVSPISALSEVTALNARGIKCGWNLIEGASHEINLDVVNKVRELINQYGT